MIRSYDKRDFVGGIRVPTSCINQKEITWVGPVKSGETLKGTGSFLKSESLEVCKDRRAASRSHLWSGSSSYKEVYSANNLKELESRSLPS